MTTPATFPRRCTRCTRPATHYVKDELGVTEGVSGDLLCGRHAAKCGLPTRGLPPAWRVSACIECARMPKRHERCPVCAYLVDNGVPATGSAGAQCRGPEDRAAALDRGRCVVKMGGARYRADLAKQEAQRAEREALLGYADTEDADSAARGAGESEE